MTLYTCIEGLCGYGISLLNRDGRLVIQSASYQLTDAQTASLKAHKPQLLTILPDNTCYTPGDLLNAAEAYEERVAIMSESRVDSATIEMIAAAQARTVLLSLPV